MKAVFLAPYHLVAFVWAAAVVGGSFRFDLLLPVPVDGLPVDPTLPVKTAAAAAAAIDADAFPSFALWRRLIPRAGASSGASSSSSAKNSQLRSSSIDASYSPFKNRNRAKKQEAQPHTDNNTNAQAQKNDATPLSNTITATSIQRSTSLRQSCTESCCRSNYLLHDSNPPIARRQQQQQQYNPQYEYEYEYEYESAEAAAAVCPICEICASGNPLAFLPAYVQYILILVLITMSAIFSGLTLGFLGLDKTGLQIVMDSDDAINAAYARRIYPIRKNGNLLLCTLLLGNTSVNALLSILVADKFGGIVGVVSSTMLILVFGEIIPQALCNRYALYLGSRAIPLVLTIIVLFYPIAKPLALILDCVLGEELTTTYSAKEMMKMLQIHVEENAMDHETANTMTGALKYKNVAVRDVMTPLDNVFMLKTDEKLNFETIAKIFKTGYSRVPVFEVDKNNVVGLLFVKDLIFVDPDDETRVSEFIDIFGRGVHVVWPDDTLGDVLRELKNGRSHMALVRDVNKEDESQDPFYEVRGIITLEDIIEEILGHEIVDETDAFLDGTHSVRLDRADAFKFARLRLLDSNILEERLPIEETRAVTAHLLKNYDSVVSLLTENQLQHLVAETPVTVLPTAKEELGAKLPVDLLYTKDVPDDVCTMILSGKVTVLVGVDEFRSDVSSWSLLGAGALDTANYTPDFSAFVSSGPCRCLRINRSRFASAVDASAFERSNHTPVPVTASFVSMDSGQPSVGVRVGAKVARKVKLLSALRILDKTSHTDDTTSKAALGRRSVSFADSVTLRGGQGNVRATSLMSSKANSDTMPASSGRFDFIGSPDVSERSEEDNAS